MKAILYIIILAIALKVCIAQTATEEPPFSDDNDNSTFVHVTAAPYAKPPTQQQNNTIDVGDKPSNINTVYVNSGTILQLNWLILGGLVIFSFCKI